MQICQSQITTSLIVGGVVFWGAPNPPVETVYENKNTTAYHSYTRADFIWAQGDCVMKEIKNFFTAIVTGSNPYSPRPTVFSFLSFVFIVYSMRCRQKLCLNKLNGGFRIEPFQKTAKNVFRDIVCLLPSISAISRCHSIICKVCLLFSIKAAILFHLGTLFLGFDRAAVDLHGFYHGSYHIFLLNCDTLLQSSFSRV